MARNIVKDYIEYDRNFLRDYINIITEKKLNSKIVDMIIDVYINVRYFDINEHIKDYPIDNIEYYVVERFKKEFSDKNQDKNIPLITSALVILRYIFLVEKYSKNKNAIKQLDNYEERIKEKYDDTKILISNLVKDIKDNLRKKEKYINKLTSSDFSVVKYETNIKNLNDLVLDNTVKIPDLFSEIAINRVYNSGVIYEDRMLVFYILTVREILIDMINYNYDRRYLIDFPSSLLDKKNKLTNLFKTFDLDYLKERIILKVLFSDYLDKKDEYDKLIHEGYSFAIEMDIEIENNTTLLNIFSYIIVNNEKDKKLLEKYFDNIVLI